MGFVSKMQMFFRAEPQTTRRPMRIDNPPDNVVVTSIAMPRQLRLALDEVRVARARRSRRLPPRLRDIVIEALEAFLQREAAR
jgi:hypothetical protein